MGLAGEDDVVSAPFERAAQRRLRLAVPVALGGVEVRDAARQRVLDHVHLIPEPTRAEPHVGDLEPRSSQHHAATHARSRRGLDGGESVARGESEQTAGSDLQELPPVDLGHSVDASRGLGADQRALRSQRPAAILALHADPLRSRYRRARRRSLRRGTRVHEGRIDQGWWVVRGPNGGYVAALLLRALAAEVPAERAPRSLTVHYTAPPAEGAVRIDTRVERIGRSLTTVSGRMIRSRLAAGGFVEEDGEVWSRKGVLLAQSRQLAVIG